ncbi:predicted protein [Nematostella vectensis]|uniref:COMM domain-containing protein 6 n=2 Tax=Nematostella vectensis TaxID=45351 RepID=A7S761_NEMVE|nr:predicted protein [Nematostella vectensis]|eukprot:XP_001632500.1 predicted protein [Nematostella vectensis]
MVERALTNIPQGYAAAVENVNTIPQDILAEVCQDVALFLQYKITQIPLDRYKKKLQEMELQCDPKTVFNVISYVFRSAGKKNCSVDQLISELNSSMLWSVSSLAVIKRIWTEQGKFICSPDLAKTLNVGQLVDMGWKLSMGMSSSSCRSLNAPFITAAITVASPSGDLTTKSLEMTILEFKKFSSHLREIASVLETV